MGNREKGFKNTGVTCGDEDYANGRRYYCSRDSGHINHKFPEQRFHGQDDGLGYYVHTWDRTRAGFENIYRPAALDPHKGRMWSRDELVDLIARVTETPAQVPYNGNFCPYCPDHEFCMQNGSVACADVIAMNEPPVEEPEIPETNREASVLRILLTSLAGVEAQWKSVGYPGHAKTIEDLRVWAEGQLNYE